MPDNHERPLMKKGRLLSAALICAVCLAASCAPAAGVFDGIIPADDEDEPQQATQGNVPAESEAASAERVSPSQPEPAPAFDWERTYEAEDARLTALDIYDTPAGGKAVGLWTSNRSKLTFSLTIPKAGYYELDFLTSGIYGESSNTLTVNGRVLKGILKTPGNTYEISTVLTQLHEGENEVTIERGQGFIYIDSMNVRACAGLQDDIYRVDYTLSNPNATERTAQLFAYLQTIYGSYTLAGQYASDKGIHSPEVSAIYQLTGKYPAILGIDLMDYSPSRVAYGAKTNATDYALEWAQSGGILTLIWHWNAPKDLIDSSAQPWWDGYNTSATKFDLKAALDGSDPEGYRLLLRDIDAIAVQLKRLADEDIPVLWRPLHEASGGWFWWGSSGADNYIKLWRVMYDRLTNVHRLNNLIWVYNGQAASWYPGDDYVDIIAEDTYLDPYDYESLYNLFYKALGYTDAQKMIGLAENGTIPDPGLLIQDNARWLFFITWSDLFVVNPKNGKISDRYNELQHFIDVYDNQTILTLDELPKW
jgi:mannan endo-1,4-beta-mannosidase